MGPAPASLARRVPAFAAAGLLLGLLLADASAVPWRDDLDGVKTALQQRYAVLPEPASKEEARRLAALEKCFRILDATSTSDEKDLSMAAALSKVLDKAFPGDAAFGTALDGALDSMALRVQGDRDRLGGFLAAQGNSLRDPVRVQARIAAAGERLAEAAAAPDRASRAKALAAALKMVRSGWKTAFAGVSLEGIEEKTLRVAAGTGEMTALLGGESFAAHIATASIRDGLLVVMGREVTGLSSGTFRAVDFLVPSFHGTGTYDLGFLVIVPQVLVGIGSLEPSDVYATLSTSSPYRATLTVTAYDEERRFVEGTLTGLLVALDPERIPQELAVTGLSFRIPLR